MTAWPADLEQAVALLRAMSFADAPAWLRTLADRRSKESDAHEDWAWSWAATRIASEHPDRLLAFLAALRPIAATVKRHALDAIGERLAVGEVEEPTLAACRAAIAEPDAAPRRRSIFGKDPAPQNVDALLVGVVLEALGCLQETLSPPQISGDPELDRAPTGSSAERTRVVVSRMQSARCIIAIERTETYFPGDVNEPARATEYVSVCGTRDDGAKLALNTQVDSRDLWLDVEAAADERDRILATVWRAFGRRTISGISR